MFFKPAAPSLQGYNGTTQSAIFQTPNRLRLLYVAFCFSGDSQNSSIISVSQHPRFCQDSNSSLTFQSNRYLFSFADPARWQWSRAIAFSPFASAPPLGLCMFMFCSGQTARILETWDLQRVRVLLNSNNYSRIMVTVILAGPLSLPLSQV